MRLLRSLVCSRFLVAVTPCIFFLCPVRSDARQLSSFAPADSLSPIEIPRLESAITFDGYCDEPAWKDIEPLPMVAQLPSFGAEPSERTEVMLAHDDEYFYLAARCFDREPEGIQATTAKRDDLPDNSDSIGIILDTFNDNENGLGFATTPTGSRIDTSIYGDMTNSGGMSSNWNTFWDVKTAVTDRGWFVEMRIPFSSLRFQERDGRVVMGCTVFRWIARKEERIIFPAIPQNWGTSSYLKPSLSRDIVLTGVSGGNPVYITPYAVGGLGRNAVLNSAQTAYRHDNTTVREAGVDVKYGLTSNLTLDLTVNTDFAQVEADDEQVNLTRFSLFFPEKRLFFLERASNFDFKFYGSSRLFHSRSIGIYNGKQVPIYGGARVVGRAGRWDVGFLNMQTEKIGDMPSENFGVFRLRRQVINPNSYVGGIVTNRMGTDGSYNTAYGVDGVIRMFGDDYLNLNWAQTFDREDAEKVSPLDRSHIRAHWERFRHTGWAYGLNYNRAGKGYLPGMGYEQYPDLSNWIHFLRYGWNAGKTSRWFHYQWYEDFYLRKRIEDGSVNTFLLRTGVNGYTKKGYSAALNLTFNRENVREHLAFSESAIVPEGTYEFYGVTGNFSTPGGQRLSFSSGFTAGQFYDGNRLTVSSGIARSFSSLLDTGLSYQYNFVDFPERGQEFTAHIGSFRMLAMLSVKYSVTALVQYNSASDRAVANIRFRYNPHEGNDLYLVYDEGINTDRDTADPLLPRSANRTVMVKYTYTFIR